MSKAKVYDLPTRLFHWLFAGLFLGAFAIAKLTDDDLPLFSQHMLLGLLLGFLTLLRIAWGLLGSKYARFSSFPLSPAHLARYLRGILAAKGKRHLGHNPASAWAALLMIAVALGLGVTGSLMATGQKETYEDLHELLANAFAAVAAAHVAGVGLHQLRHRDGIALSMLHGKKAGDESELGIRHSHRLAALGLVGIMAAFALHLYKNYDPAQASTSIFGLKLSLGESASEKRGHELEGTEREGKDDE